MWEKIWFAGDQRQIHSVVSSFWPYSNFTLEIPIREAAKHPPVCTPVLSSISKVSNCMIRHSTIMFECLGVLFSTVGIPHFATVHVEIAGVLQTAFCCWLQPVLSQRVQVGSGEGHQSLIWFVMSCSTFLFCLCSFEGLLLICHHQGKTHRPIPAVVISQTIIY